MDIIVKPTEGIFFNDTKILLYENITEVKKRLDKFEENKKTKWSKEKIWIRDYEICLEIENDIIISIMLYGGFDSKCRVLCYDFDVFGNKSNEVYQLFKKQYNEEIVEEGGYSYIFPNISLSIYRDFLPDEYEDEEKFIEEWTSDSCTKEEAKIIFEEDSKKAFYWNSILIGIKDYYTSVI